MEVRPGRYTADIEGDFVVFLIGMRFNHPLRIRKWLPVATAMPRMTPGRPTGDPAIGGPYRRRRRQSRRSEWLRLAGRLRCGGTRGRFEDCLRDISSALMAEDSGAVQDATLLDVTLPLVP
jgi:hypothetical protein